MKPRFQCSPAFRGAARVAANAAKATEVGKIAVLLNGLELREPSLSFVHVVVFQVAVLVDAEVRISEEALRWET